ncbi:MAG: hypothetical protein GY793_07615 [Proteobacteria bacterium]|nr:hypothetical protein [Pseudomonadota bacterium]
MSKFYSIYPNEDFFKESAKIILQNAYDNEKPESLSKCLVWVPSSRMVQSLRHALTKELGNYAILPEIKTVGLNDSDIQSMQFFNSEDARVLDEIYPKTSKILLFAEAIKVAMPNWTAQQRFTEALSLTKLHQDLQNYDVTLDELKNAVPSELAFHWEKNLKVVQVVFDFYENFLKKNQKQDLYTLERKSIDEFLNYRNEILEVFAIGFNDSTVLGKKLLCKIAELEKGHVIFPYINKDIIDNGSSVFQNISKNLLEKSNNLKPNDSEYAISKLAELLKATDKNIEYVGKPSNQLGLVNKAFITADQTYLWADQASYGTKLENLNIVNAENTIHEAKTIALIMREALIEKDKTCALISPNRGLAQKVIQELKKWGVNVNDSAGIPLQKTAKGQFCIDLLNVIIENFSAETVIPVITSSQINKELGFDFKKSTEDFVELAVLGANIDSSLEAIERKIKQQLPWQDPTRTSSDKSESALKILKMLKEFTQILPLETELTIKEWGRRHLELVLKFISEDKIFDSEVGKALLELLTNLKDAETDTKVNLRTYLHTFSLLAQQIVVRESKNLHPRLFVWGAPESRLQKIDRVIVADFNDSTWPGKVSSNLWLNPSIRQQLNMPDISVSAGLNGYDFFNQLFASEVFITRSKQTNEGPTLQSRFLIRLENTLNTENYKECVKKGEKYLRLLELAEKHKVDDFLTQEKAESAFTLAEDQKFPEFVSASSFKSLANCPYKFYLEKVLYIKPIDDIQGIPANIWGFAVHLMLEEFANKNKFPLEIGKKGSYLADFHQIIDKFFAKINSDQLELSWRYKLETIAKGFIQISIETKNNIRLTEKEIKYNGLRAILDRVDQVEDGYNIIDYKTGEAPSKKDMLMFKDPQLLIESYLLEKHNKSVKDVQYCKVKGFGSKPIESISMNKKDDFEDIKHESYRVIEAILEHFASRDVEFYPHSNGDFNAKTSTCKYCKYSGICRKF